MKTPHYSTLASLFAFVILFPLFYLYHYGVSYGMPAFLHGYTARAVLVCLPFLSIAYWLSYKRASSAVAVDVLFFGFLIFQALWLFLSSSYDQEGFITDSYLGVLAIWTGFYLLARLLALENRGAVAVFLLSQSVMLVVIVSETRSGVFTLAVEERTVTYQAFAIVYLLTTLLSLACIKSRILQWGQLITAFVALFLIGARSEWLALALFAFLYFAMAERPVTNMILLVGLFVLLLASIQYLEVLPGSRFYDLVFSGASGTRVGREAADQLAIQTLSADPIVGAFAAYPPGGYAHNILSVWVDFGIIGLCWFSGLMLLPVVLLRKQWRFVVKDPFGLLAFALMLSSIALVLTVKVFTYFAIPFAVGLAASRLSYYSSIRANVGAF